MARRWFSTDEAVGVRGLLEELRHAERPRQKSLRGRLRSDYGFYITEFSHDQAGMTRGDFDALVRRGVIRVIDDPDAGVRWYPSLRIAEAAGVARCPTCDW
jgi:hypothetical protein